LREFEKPEVAEVPRSEKMFARLHQLWEQRRVLARCALAGLGLGTVLAFLLPAQYESTVQLMPPDSQSNSGAMLAALSAKAGGSIGAVAGDLLGANSTGALFVGMLRSRTLEDRLVQRFALKRIYGTKLEEDARSRLANNTGLSEDHKSGIISLSVVDHDPARAAALAEAYAEELERLVSELSTSAAHREKIFLEDRLKVVKRELDQASEDFSQFASRNTAINIPEQGKALVEAAAALEGHLIAAESELKGLSEIYTANNVRVRSAQARLSELQHQLEKLNGDSSPGKNDLAKNDLAKNDLVRNGSLPNEHSTYPSLRQLPLLGVTYADLLRRTKIQEAVYETLTQQYELAKVQEAKETPSVKILDAASLPERKVFPPRLLVMFWSAVLGLAVEVLVVLGRARWRETDSRHPAKALAEEVLHTVNAVMPWSPPHGSRAHAIIHGIWMRFAEASPRLGIFFAEIHSAGTSGEKLSGDASSSPSFPAVPGSVAPAHDRLG
jgi:capsule polysaccharide export protein KpsE/RkpR